MHYLGGHASYSAGNYDVNIPTYNFNDQVIANSRYHVVNYTVPLMLSDYYYYDHMGRRIDAYKQLWTSTVTNPMTLISRNQYDLLGQLQAKRLHSTDYGSSFLQSIAYAYNPRGWLSTAVSSGNLFNEELQYEAPSTGKQYNGNIAKMLYSGTYSGSKTFIYGYDKLNRLTNATATGNTLDEGLTYDVMGNITNLSRGGQSYSSLGYSYTGNQLSTVSGSGFTTRNYAYDGNGNATSDGGSKTIDYNILNLPRKVRSGGTELANYTYDATGNKLSNSSTSSGANDGTWEYVDGIVYHNGSIAFISTEEGRAVPNGGGNYTYQYNLKDHLGNNRVSFYSNSGTATVLQEDEYYAFGLRRGLYDASNNNRYLYNGKEIQTDLSNQYDYGARFYDPVIGRWTSVDPLAEKARIWSPYNYTINNPIRFIDPDGREIVNIGEGVKFTGEDAKIAFSSIQQQVQTTDGINGIHFVFQSQTPTIYKHTLDAFRKGKVPNLTYDPDPKRVAQRRYLALKGYPSMASFGLQRDEYPYASTVEGGQGAEVAYVPAKENSIQGQELQALYRTIKPGNTFMVIPVPKDKEPDNDVPVGASRANNNRNNLNNAAKVGGAVVGMGITYEIVKWGIAAALAPETGGASLIPALATP